MPPRSTKRFEGFSALAGQLKDLSDPKQIGKVLRAGVRQAMTEPRRRARALIPVGIEAHFSYLKRLLPPGYAKKSIRIITKVDRSGLKATAILGVLREAYYAVQYVELGTSKMAAQPWLRPAFLASRDPAVRAVGAGINEWIKDIARNPSAKTQRNARKAYGPSYAGDYMRQRSSRLNANAAQFDGDY